MAHDLVIRGGEVVDGSGRGPVAADVAIDGGRITTVGVVDQPGRDEVDAAGCVVTPGFIDLHTHLDAQVGWDRLLTPSSWHGVTTALLGNCGMTFAPVRPGEAYRLAEMMETVEDIPRAAILDALPFTWESYGEYLDFVEHTSPGLNIAGMVGHCAIRYYVMGDRAVDDQPTAAEIAEMARVASDSLDQGAAGFSTSRIPGHVLPDRRPVPGTHASRDELVAIAEAIRGRGLFQGVLDPGNFDHDIALMTEVGIATGGRVLLTAVAVDPRATGTKQPTPEVLADALAKGADITGTIMPRSGGTIIGLRTRLPWQTPAWRALAELGPDDRAAAIADASTRATLVAEAADAPSRLSPRHMYSMGTGEVAQYMVGRDQSLESLAAAAGEPPAETFLRISSETEGRANFTVVTFNRNADVLGEILASDRFLPGLGDAGAHLTGIVDASYSTTFLTHWVRDTGRVTLGEAVRRLTGAPADLLGLTDRGRLAAGAAADVNVIDLPALAALQVEPASDAPLGATRLVQRARGYRATLVNGQPLLRDGVHTGAHPGQVLRPTAR